MNRKVYKEFTEMRLIQAGASGLHSSTFRLYVSAFGGIGVAFKGCLGGVSEVLGDIGGYRMYSLSETAQVELEIERV